MQDLLPYYERELAFLRQYASEFAQDYPKIAGRLLMSDDVAEDPHVERLIESFALLGARISKKLEDDYPEFTESLLDVLYPHYLRPFPSCSIACFEAGAAAAQLTAPVVIPRGTELRSRNVRGVSCRFRTSYDVTLAPLQLARTAFSPIINAPETTQLPARAVSALSLQFNALGQAGAAAWPDTLRLMIDGESSLRSALRDTLAMRVLKVYVEPAGSGRWIALPDNPLEAVGFADDEALLDYPERSHPAYRLLTELFAFPDKFDFFDLDFKTLVQAVGSADMTLHFAIGGLPADSSTARLLETVDNSNVRLGCTPVVNLFQQRGEPIRVSHTAVSYPVLADARRPYAYEVHSVDSVKRVRQTPQGEEVTQFRPFYSLRHGEHPDDSEQYWVTHLDELMASRSPGYELEMSVVDLDFNPVAPQTDVLGLDLTCSNRDLPTQLAYGVSGGDLVMEGGSAARTIALLRKPTPPRRFERGRGAQWRLISQLSLNHLSLAEDGPTTLRELLRLYDLPRSAISSRQIQGVVGLQHRAATAWLPGQQFASMVRGVEIRLTIDESNFVGAGVSTFAQTLDRFFGLYVQANSFTQLVVLSHNSGEVLIQCPPRSGASILA